MTSVPFAGLTLLTAGFETMADWVAAEAAVPKSTPQIVAHVNANNYYFVFHGPGAHRPFEGRFVLLFDGIGMKLAAWILHGRWLPDLNGTDLFPRLMEKCAERGIRLYFLGGTAAVVEETVRRAVAAYPGLCISGSRPGYFSEAEEASVVTSIRASGADLLVLARGSGLQRDFILRNLPNFGVSVIWNAGGLFNFMSGRVPRAPGVFRTLRLEWLFRFVREPGRMWHRNGVVGPWLLAHAIRHRLADDTKAFPTWKHSRLGK